jgi:hypothetical protein
MKRKIVIRSLFFFLAGAVSLYSCKKDSTTSSNNTLTSNQVIQVQNTDAQDALADKTEEDVDNKLDELQNNNYSSVSMKALGTLTDTVVITVDHPDTIMFPKVVTLTFYSFRDSSLNENITKNGKIKVTITSSNPNHRKLVSRAFVFSNFSVSTDSTTVTLNGTRNVTRQSATVKLSGFLSERLSVIDNITTTTRFAVVSTGKTDTLKFTRNVNKVRTAVYHFRNVIYRPLEPHRIFWRYIASSDTITYTGSVTGIDEKGDTYSKNITSPLEVTNFKGSLLISSGAITYSVGTDTYQITFEEDPAHKHFTLVTVKNNQTGNTTSFDRRFGRIFRRWW